MQLIDNFAFIKLPLIGETNLNGFMLFVFIFCVLATLGFEFVNGFHDTANAVATVIYTKTLNPQYAIVWSGIWNFLGVFLIGTAVAMSLLKLVPLDKLITLPVAVGACLAISILVSSVIWNLGTWYIGIPLSSTHTLIGSMIGASLAFTWYYAGPGVNWSKAVDIGLSLLISPVIGFGGAALLMMLEKKLIKSPRLFHTPENDADIPPLPVRILLVTTCTLVSFFHGSNDGQKGVGLLMLILVVFVPARFAFNPSISDRQTITLLNNTQQHLRTSQSQKTTQQKAIQQVDSLIELAKLQSDKKEAAATSQKFQFRQQIQKVVGALKTVTDNKELALSDASNGLLKTDMKGLQKVTDFAPIWVIVLISLSLGLGTMVGWKRIVVTIGEKIGVEHLNYAEGATAEIVAAATIGLSTGFGLPVSTTHVLSSGVAGAMRASKGTKNLNFGTLKSIGMAWLLTLPAGIIISFLIFMLLHWLCLGH